ncbi:hypothetical protein LUZ60_003696 [Juncus effusus]|nr:hypothetical protein LUZ60_003696 [Juncus effusus]
MSLAAESPSPSASSVSSGSTDDFAALLAAELEEGQEGDEIEENEVQQEEEDEEFKDEEEEDEEVEEQSLKRRRLMYENTEDTIGASVEISKHETNGSTSEQVKETCLHPSLIRNLCAYCGKFVDEEAGSSTAFGYIHKDLRLSASEIERYRKNDLKNLLRDKKLILVLDLDHTLINSSRFMDLIPEENILFVQAEAKKDDPDQTLFRLGNTHMLTKLRPFVRTFLKEAREMFELYIYTMGEKSYANEIAKLIDPDEKYFASKVISQADCTTKHQKGLDVVMGDDKLVVILDDTEVVWQKHRDNLIVMERYHYFASSVRQFRAGKSYSERNEDESESDGVLASILNVLKRAHTMFFDPGSGSDLAERDVREVLKSIRKEILKGCKIIFSGVIPLNDRPQNHQIWKLAEEMGAECCTELDSSVTHVVASLNGTQKAKWAKNNCKWLVTRGWIEAAGFLWRRQREEEFMVGSEKGEKGEKNEKSEKI